MALHQSLLLLVGSLCLTVLVDCGLVPDDPHAENRIVGGSKIDIHQAPWQVFISCKGYMCGGSIISSRWVITAAHCTVRFRTSDIYMLIGTDVLTKGGSQYRVKKVVNHERYDDKVFLNDISLLKSATEMDLKLHHLRPVRLPAWWMKRPPPGTTLQVTGFGLMENRERTTSLMSAAILLRDFKECDFFANTDESKQICAYSLGKDSCYGDSGGPLVKGHLLVGIVSYGAGNSECGDLPSIYTDVAAYRLWIKKHSGV